jgi:hypothetical protein
VLLHDDDELELNELGSGGACELSAGVDDRLLLIPCPASSYILKLKALRSCVL